MLYDILAHVTVKGVMHSTIRQYEKVQNGFQAWHDIYTVMEQEEMQETVEFDGLSSLVSLQKNHGFERLLNDFFDAIRKAEVDSPMKLSRKKFYLLNSVKKDKRYATEVAMCEKGSETLIKTIQVLRKKATELNDLDHPSRQHNNASTNGRNNNKKKWNKNYSKSGSNSGKVAKIRRKTTTTTTVTEFQPTSSTKQVQRRRK